MTMAQTAARPASPPPEYRLGVEDVVAIFVWKEPLLSSTVAVRPDGKITTPLVGEVSAAGKTAIELQETISRELRKYFLQPVVTIIVKEVNSPRIFVLGEVRKAGSFVLRQKITVLDAIAMAGGIPEDARANRVIVLRNGSSAPGRSPQRIELDLKRLLSDERSGPIYLQPFDTVYVQH